MEYKKTEETYPEKNIFEFEHLFNNRSEKEIRIDELLDLHSPNVREKSLHISPDVGFEASLIKNPINTQTAFSQFGLMLGIFPPMALFGTLIANSNRHSDDYWVFPLLIFVNAVCAVVGFFSGKVIGRMVAETEKWSWGAMLLTLPLIGILWGIMTGGAGGLFIFVIGAIFGAFIAALIGGIALPVFTIFHRWLKKGDLIERDQFLPLSLGISLTIAAIILGQALNK